MNFEKINNINTAKVEQEKGLEEISFFDKAEAGFLLKPQSIKNELENLRGEIKKMEESFAQPGSLKSENEEIEKLIPIKESQIRKLETVLTVTEDKIKNDYEKKGPNNVDLIINQEDKILRAFKGLEESKGADLSFVPMARNLVHEWNIADSKDYFADEQKIKEALLIVIKNKKDIPSEVLSEEPVEEVEKKESDEENVAEESDEGGVVEEEIKEEAKADNKKTEEKNKDIFYGKNKDLENEEAKQEVFAAYFKDKKEQEENQENQEDIKVGDKSMFYGRNVEMENEQARVEAFHDHFKDKEVEEEKKDIKKRTSIFDRIRNSKKLRWLVATISLAAIGLGIFKKAESSEKDDKKEDKIEHTISFDQENKIDSDKIVNLSAEDFSNVNEAGENSNINLESGSSSNLEGDASVLKVFSPNILEKINSEVRDTIVEDVGPITKMVVLEKGSGVGLINDYKMHNSHKVNFIDGQTGVIYRDLAAISRTVHEGDVVMQSEDGGIYVLCFKGVHDSGKTGYENLTDVNPDLTLENNLENNSEGNIDNNIDNNIGQSNISSDIENATTTLDSAENITTPLDSTENSITSLDSTEKSTISLDSAEIIDLTPALKEYRAQQRAQESGDTLVKTNDSIEVKTSDSTEVKTDDSTKVDINNSISAEIDTSNTKFETQNDTVKKNNFFQRLFQKKDKNEKGQTSVDEKKQPLTNTEIIDNHHNVDEKNHSLINAEKTNNHHSFDSTILSEDEKVNDLSKTYESFSPDKEGVKKNESNAIDYSREKDALRSSGVEIPEDNSSAEEDEEGGGDDNKTVIKKDKKVKGPKYKGRRPLSSEELLEKVEQGKVKGIKIVEEAKPGIDTLSAKELTKRINSGEIRGLKVEKGQETSINRDTIRELNEIINSLNANNSEGSKYIIEKVQDKKDVPSWQVETFLTFKRVKGGYLVENSDGTNSHVIVDDSLMRSMEGYGRKTITCAKINGTWRSVSGQIKP